MPSLPRELLLPSFEAEGPCDLAPPSHCNELGGSLSALATGLSHAESAGALLALSEHASVLRLIWEAHARGAIALPPTLASRVVQARRSMPTFLSASSATSAFAHASMTHEPPITPS